MSDRVVDTRHLLSSQRYIIQKQPSHHGYYNYKKLYALTILSYLHRLTLQWLG